MTQLNIRSREIGWGDLGVELSYTKCKCEKLKQLEESIIDYRNEVNQLIVDMNNSRVQRVLSLLEQEKRGICILHSLIFRYLGIEESLVPIEALEIVVVNKSWTKREGMYDGDKEEVPYHSEYETTACLYCRYVVRNAFTDTNFVTYSILPKEPEVKTFEELYTIDLIDKISSEYYQMPVVTRENIRLL